MPTRRTWPFPHSSTTSANSRLRQRSSSRRGGSPRITAVADAYDAIRSERPYKAAQSHEHACEQIAQSSGTQFDPSVVSAFMGVEADIALLARSPKALADRLIAILTSDHGQGKGTCRLPLLADLTRKRGRTADAGVEPPSHVEGALMLVETTRRLVPLASN